MNSVSAVEIADYRDAYIQATADLVSEIDHAVAQAAAEVGADVLVAALCDRTQETAALAA